MISRRSFLAALSCLPFVGKFVPQKVSARPCDYGIRVRSKEEHQAIYERHLRDLFENTPAHLIDHKNGAQTLANIVDEAAVRALTETLYV